MVVEKLFSLMDSRHLADVESQPLILFCKGD